MKAKLFLFYLRIRKLLPAIALLCLAVTIYNQFLDYRYSWANTAPWMVEKILTGDRFVASRSGKQVEVKLCGVISSTDNQLK